MKLFGIIVVILLLIAAIPTGLYFLNIHPSVFLAEYPQVGIIALFGFPFLVVSIVLLLTLTDRGSYRYSTEYFEQSDLSVNTDMAEHAAVGLLLAVLQDISRAHVIEPGIYSPELAFALQQECQQRVPYIQRGYRFHFDFRPDDGYRVQLVRVLHEQEVIMEVQGHFDYFVERNGVQHLTPHAFDRSEPLLRVAGAVRLRMKKEPKRHGWIVSGISENVRGLVLGAPTQT